MDPPTEEAADAPAVPSRAAALREFPAGAPSVLAAETVALETLVHHRRSVAHDMPLEKVEKVFRDHRVDYLALVRDERVTGLCARVRLGSLLGSRYGFALYGQSPAHLAQVEHPLVFTVSTPVRRMLDRALARGAEEFHEDVVLVDEDHRLRGLIPVEKLAHLQTRLVGEQLAELRRQQETMGRQNLDLFQANQALRQAKGLNMGLFESNVLGVALLNARGQIQAHNRRLAELLNLGDGPVSIPSFDGWLSERDRAQFASLLSAHERSTPDAGSAAREFILQVNGRGARQFHFTTGWIRETGQVCAFLDDVTEQRSLERTMMRQEKQRLLDTLVGGIAHELNNKLTPVMGFADMLVINLGPEHRQSAALIAQSAREASQIIRQLLQLSKPDTGHPQSADLATLVEESLLMLKFQVRERGCEVRLQFSRDPVVVLVDPGRIKQVVINLVLNALQAMESVAAPVITVSVGWGDAGPYLSVSDTGVGIPQENLGRIFDPFFTTKGPDRGSGLGLSICFSIVRQYGGEIVVESQPGRGATFTLTLPAELSAAEPAKVSEGERPALRSGARKDARVERVLVVEDEKIVSLLLEEMLRDCLGCQVDAAGNGAEALELIAREKYGFVISDIRMPEMEGPELYLRLRDLHPDLARRFAFITGYPGEQTLQDEIARWDVPVLAKPFERTRLLEVCELLLSRGDSAAVSA